MGNIIYVVSTFVIVYLTYYIVIISKPSKLKKYILKGRETNIIKNRFNINLEKVNKRKVANYFAITNSFMIALMTFILLFIDNYIIKFIVAFVLFVILTIIFYLAIGKKIKKEEK